MDLGAILLTLFIVLVVKVTVMIFGARMVLKVYNATYQKPPKRLWLLLPEADLPEIKILWWSLVLFFISEFVCGVEAYILFRSSPVVGWLHGITSAFGMALFALGIYIFLDKRMFRYAEPGCLANRICRGCTIGEEGGCKFRFIFLLVATFVVLAAIVPFFVSTERLFTNTRKYILPFESINIWFDTTVDPLLMKYFPHYERSGTAYYIPSSVLGLVFRILPVISALLAFMGIFFLKKRREILGLRFTIFAFGLLCYSYLEIILLAATKDVLFGSLAHETAELWFLIITAEFLRRSFPPENKLQAQEATG